MTNPVDEKRLEELMKPFKYGESKGMKLEGREDYDLLLTLSLALKVVRAVQEFSSWFISEDYDNDLERSKLQPIFQAVAPFSQGEKEK